MTEPYPENPGPAEPPDPVLYLAWVMLDAPLVVVVEHGPHDEPPLPDDGGDVVARLGCADRSPLEALASAGWSVASALPPWQAANMGPPIRTYAVGWPVEPEPGWLCDVGAAAAPGEFPHWLLDGDTDRAPDDTARIGGAS